MCVCVCVGVWVGGCVSECVSVLLSFFRCIRFDDKRIVSGAYDG